MSSNLDESLVLEVFELQIKCMLASKHRMVDIASRKKLSAMQVMTLFLLDYPMSMIALTKLLSCDASYVTGIVDVLEGDKLVNRIHDPNDRRVKLIKITKKGLSVRTDILKELIKNGVNGIDSFTRNELLSFKTLLSKSLN